MKTAYPWRGLAISFAATLVFCAISYLWLDRPVAEWFKANLVGTWSDVFNRITKLGLGGVWLIPAAICAILFRWRQVRRVGHSDADLWLARANAALFLFVSVAGSEIVVDILKGLVGRLRPRELFDHGLYGFQPLSLDWAHTSFPSGHGQTAVAAMTALAAIWPPGRWLFYLAAALVAASRVVISVHYLSDVAMGAWFGAAGTVLLARAFAAQDWKVTR